MHRSWFCAALLFFFSVQRPLEAAPVVASGGIVNAASYLPGPVVAGSLIAIFGAGLASSAASSPGTPWPAVLNNVSVTINGTAVPLLFVSPSQINAQVPWGLTGQVQVVVTNDDGSSSPVTANLAAVAPAIFTVDGKQAVAYIAATRTYTFNPGQISRIARPGEYLRLYATGLGAVTNAPATGAAPDATLTVAPTLSTTSASCGDPSRELAERLESILEKWRSPKESVVLCCRVCQFYRAGRAKVDRHAALLNGHDTPRRFSLCLAEILVQELVVFD